MRLQEGEALKAELSSLGIEANLIIDETDYYRTRNEYKYLGLNRSFFHKILGNSYDTDDWRIILQDDIELADQFKETIEKVLEVAPRSVIMFYNPTNKLFKEAWEQKKHIIKGQYHLWVQCVAFHKDFIPPMLNWFDEHIVNWGADGEDALVQNYLSLTDQYFYAILPSLVQHTGYDKSTLGNQPVIVKNKRTAENYQKDYDFSAVDWEQEFRNPFKGSGVRRLSRAIKP